MSELVLSKEHIKILKKAKHRKIIRTVEKNDDLNFLYENNLIKMTEYHKDDDHFVQPYLTEPGKARLYFEISKYRNKIITIILSIATLLLTAVPVLFSLFNR